MGTGVSSSKNASKTCRLSEATFEARPGLALTGSGCICSVINPSRSRGSGTEDDSAAIVKVGEPRTRLVRGEPLELVNWNASSNDRETSIFAVTGRVECVSSEDMGEGRAQYARTGASTRYRTSQHSGAIFHWILILNLHLIHSNLPPNDAPLCAERQVLVMYVTSAKSFLCVPLLPSIHYFVLRIADIPVYD